jgi:apolipoprotein N-acyltransferase
MATAPATTAKPAPDAPPFSPRQRDLLCACTAATSAVILWFSFFPFALGFLGWVAVVPLLLLVRSQATPRMVYTSAMCCGLIFFVPALHWMSVADKSMVAAWLALSAYCALYFPAAIYAIRCLERWRLPLVISVPLVWSALEYFRSFALTGFAWYYLAHTQHDFLAMIQITDLGGVYLVTFVVAAVNALLFDIAYQFTEIRRWFHQADLEPYRTYASIEFLNRGVMASWLFRRNLILEGIAVVAVVVGAYAYGQMRLSENRFQAGPTVCLLQSNLDQRLREAAAAAERGERTIEKIEQHFTKLCMRASFGHQRPPDLVIWPETSHPHPWYSVSPKIPIERVPTIWTELEDDTRKRLGTIAKHTKVRHLVGINSFFLSDDEKTLQYNSALLLNPRTINDRAQVDGKFDKVHRVPFGEFVPLKDWLPFLAWLTPYEGPFGIEKGEKLTRFELDKHRFGVLICYEDTDPALARRYVQDSEDGPSVDFLVNISNDGWFDGSAEHEEHLAVCRFRAIECRRAMVRAVNMGVSAVIDSNGRVLKPRLVNADAVKTEAPVWMVTGDLLKGYADLPISEWSAFKKTSGVLKAVVPIDQRATLYAVAGDWLPIGCWAILLGSGGWALARRRFAGGEP